MDYTNSLLDSLLPEQMLHGSGMLRLTVVPVDQAKAIAEIEDDERAVTLPLGHFVSYVQLSISIMLLAFAFVALIRNRKTLHNALQFASRGTRSVSHM